MKRAILFLVLFLMPAFTSARENIFQDASWPDKIRPDHPRLFFNSRSFEAVKSRALNEESKTFADMKRRVDALLGKEIVFKDPLAVDGTKNSDHEYGTRAAESAFVYLVTGDKKYLDRTKSLLTALVDYYTMRNENGLNIQWYAFSRINALAAYDWIYNDLTEDERTAIGVPFFKAVHYMLLPRRERKRFFRENTGDYKTGFYGPPCLAWYAGVVFHKTGIDDPLAEQLLRKGCKDYLTLLEYRNGIAGNDGGASTAALGYCMGAYPWAEFNFFHTVQAALDVDISGDWPYVPNIVHYIFWNRLPGDKEFGFGDTSHAANALPLGQMHIHLSQMIHFYGKSRPDLLGTIRWMFSKVKRQSREVIPVVRFLLDADDADTAPEFSLENLPKARHFENMGQIFLRSGSGDDDTYALFTAGGVLRQHKHFDNNNFVIFKKGFLALDTGTRPEPGQHLSHYYCRTVAHNGILIRMPDEKMPNYWGSPASGEEKLPVPNDGGQCSQLGSKVVAFEENADYVYIASDATESYNKDKTSQVVRQFVFLPPDCFVVFDRVNAVKAEYPKTWLLHTAREPVIDGNVFRADQGDGRLYCRTIFPENAKLDKIGGPGKQFWSDGRNWPLPDLKPGDWGYRPSGRLPDTHELYGQWRVEVAPPVPAEDDYFLHLIQVGDLSLRSMVDSKPVKQAGAVGVKFTYKGKEYELVFNTGGDIGAKLSVRP